MKSTYETPNMETVVFSPADIVTTSFLPGLDWGGIAGTEATADFGDWFTPQS